MCAREDFDTEAILALLVFSLFAILWPRESQQPEDLRLRWRRRYKSTPSPNSWFQSTRWPLDNPQCLSEIRLNPNRLASCFKPVFLLFYVFITILHFADYRTVMNIPTICAVPTKTLSSALFRFIRITQIEKELRNACNPAKICRVISRQVENGKKTIRICMETVLFFTVGIPCLFFWF